MPGSNPRDVEEILQSLDNTYRDIDPAIDNRKGPVAVINYGFSVELAATEDNADYLRSVYQLANPEALEDNDIIQLGLNYGKDPNIGRSSRVLVYFYRLSRPEAGETYTADVGTLVASDDNRFVYATLDEASMSGDFADVYFNATYNRYEVGVLAEAIAVGVDYNLPPLTVNKIATPLDGFDGVENRDFATGGADPIDKTQFRNIIWDAVQGVGSDLGGAIVTLIEDLDPTGFEDIAMVPSTDYTTFARVGQLNSKLGYDVYLISNAIRETVQSGFTQGGETYLDLENKPALAVRFVSVGGVNVAFSFESDTDPAYEGSPLANDRVTFPTPLAPAQAYEIRYVYYDLIYDANEALKERSRPFETDVLVRRANPIEIIIVGTIKSISNANREDVIDDIRAFTIQYLRDPLAPSAQQSRFYTFLDPLDYQSAIENTIDGVTEFRLLRFARLDAAFMDIDVITLDGATEYAVLSPQFDVS